MRFPRRGGNYNNTSNAGLGYENCNNTRANTNTNYGARPRSQRIKRAARSSADGRINRMGGVCFPAASAANNDPCPVIRGPESP